MIIRYTKKIDSRNRVILPNELVKLAGLKVGDEVYFTLTKAGNIVIRKYESSTQQQAGDDNGERQE